MTRVDDTVRSANGHPVVICDVSPPRGGIPGQLPEAAETGSDFLYIAYNPGQSVRVNTVMTAAFVRDQLGRQAVFSLATRDMNRIAIQSLLLGASWAELDNVVLLRGDRLRSRDHGLVREVNDYTTTELLADVARMNRGFDFRGLRLRAPTSFCAGATADLVRNLDDEVLLSARKAHAGARFLLCQPQLDAGLVQDFDLRLRRATGYDRMPVLFAGVQILAADGVDFGNVPEPLKHELRAGRSGLKVAKWYAHELWEAGCRCFYVVPPVLSGGRRDYEQARDLVDYLKGL